jgi:hypothetical protein
VACFGPAAEHGLADAKRALGHCYGKGEGIAKDLSAARRWLLEAGAAGDALAFYDLFHIFYNDGNGTTDREEAFKYLRIAGEKGVAEAPDNLGRAYYNGEMVAQDYAGPSAGFVWPPIKTTPMRNSHWARVTWKATAWRNSSRLRHLLQRVREISTKCALMTAI